MRVSKTLALLCAALIALAPSLAYAKGGSSGGGSRSSGGFGGSARTSSPSSSYSASRPSTPSVSAPRAPASAEAPKALGGFGNSARTAAPAVATHEPSATARATSENVRQEGAVKALQAQEAPRVNPQASRPSFTQDAQRPPTATASQPSPWGGVGTTSARSSVPQVPPAQSASQPTVVYHTTTTAPSGNSGMGITDYLIIDSLMNSGARRDREASDRAERLARENARLREEAETTQRRQRFSTEDTARTPGTALGAGTAFETGGQSTQVSQAPAMTQRAAATASPSSEKTSGSGLWTFLKWILIFGLLGGLGYLAYSYVSRPRTSETKKQNYSLK
jgi:hypothetical protein